MKVCDKCGTNHQRLTLAIYGTLCVLVAAGAGWVLESVATTLSMLAWGVFSFALQFGLEYVRRRPALCEQLQAAQLRLQNTYAARNVLAFAFCRLAIDQGYKGGLYDDPQAPGWPVVSVTLPEGEVTWHVSQAEADQSGLPMTPREWDGHDEHLRDQRLRAFTCCTCKGYRGCS